MTTSTNSKFANKCEHAIELFDRAANLYKINKKFKDAGGELRISSPKGHVKEVFETLMLDRLFKIE